MADVSRPHPLRHHNILPGSIRAFPCPQCTRLPGLKPRDSKGQKEKEVLHTAQEAEVLLIAGAAKEGVEPFETMQGPLGQVLQDDQDEHRQVRDPHEPLDRSRGSFGIDAG